MNKINIYTDGGSRGNPGPSALGVYIEDTNGKELASIGKALGINTNNFAEYSAIVEAFLWLKKNISKFPKELEVHFYMDSQLACSQLNGLYKVKNSILRNMLFEIKKYEVELGIKIFYTHIAREYNKKADAQVNLALDNNL